MPTCEVAILAVKRGRPVAQDMSSGWYTRNDSAVGSTGMVQMRIGVY